MAVIISYLPTILASFTAIILACLIGSYMGQKLVLSKKNGLAENLSLHKTLSCLANILRFIPYIMLLFILWLALNRFTGILPVIAGAVFLEILPMAVLDTRKTLDSVSTDIINAATALGAAPEDILKLFMYPAVKEQLIRKNIYLLFYGLFCAIASLLWFSLIAR